MRVGKPILWFLISLLAWVGCGDNVGPGALQLEPESLMVMVGEDATIRARQGAFEPAEVTWTSSDETIAKVMGSGSSATVHGARTGTATITATAGGRFTTATVTVIPAALERIDITPPMPSLAAGTQTQLTATGTFRDGTTADLTSAVAWASSTTTVATVDGLGKLTGVAVGTSTITASAGGVVGQVTARVTAAQLMAIDVTPPAPSLPRGTTQQLTATGRFTDNTTQNLTAQVAWSSATTTVATVASTGIVTAANVGTSVVTATMGGISGSVTVTVTPATLVSIAVTPPNPSVAKGLTQQFTATGTFTDSSTMDLTGMVAWTSGTTATATVSATGLATAVNPGTSVITATMGGINGSTTLTVTAATLVSIAVTPPNPSIAKGLTQQFTATGTFTDSSTQDLTTSVTWSSGTTATATISNAAGSQGLATSANVGTTTITATSGGISGSTTLTVTAATLVSIAVTPPNPSIAKGLTQQFTATGTFTDSSTQDLTTSVTWSSGTTATATISNAAGSQGLATSANVGTTTITATSGGISGSTTLTVTAATLVSIQVTPVNPSIAKGLTQQFTATGTFTDSSTQNLTTTATWSSSATATATISNAAGSQGRATSVNIGTTTITATSGGISGSTTLNVTAATLVSIAVTPTNLTLALGTTQQYTAIGTFTDSSTQDLTTTATWASSNATRATISNAAGSEGLATTVALGATTISATLSGVTGSTTLTVSSASLVSIAVTPADASIALGLSQQYTAIGTFSDSSTLDITAAVTWSSTDTAVAQISNAAGSEGLAQSTGLGTTTISATQSGVTGTTTLTVTSATLVSIAVTPANPSLAKGLTQQFTAIGTFTDSSTLDLTTTATWSSSDTNVAAVSNAAGSQGLATAVNVGAATISATLSGVTGSTTLTVTPAVLVSIAVTPAGPNINVGQTVQLTATGTFTDSTTSDITALVTWTSQAILVATVSATGLVAGVSGGSAQIDATSGGITGSTTVNVTAVAPTVTLTSPADAATGVSATTSIAVTFSLAMNPVTLTTQSTGGACSGTLQVSLDNFTTCIGLGAVAMSGGNTVATATPAPALAFGTTYKIRVTTGAQSGVGVGLAATFTQATGFTTRLDAHCATGLVISQVYGGGGNVGAQFTNDFIELHNPTSVGISLAGMAVQYTSAAGTGTWAVTNLPSVTLAPGAFFLIQEAAGATPSGSLPTPDATGTIAMGNTAGKVALTSNITALSGGCPTSSAIVDLIGYGGTASCFEGMPTAATSNTTSAQRAGGGCTDNNNNNTDYAIAAPAPRNSSAANVKICACAANETNAGFEADFCNLQFPPATTTATGALSELLFGRVFEAGVTEAAGPNATVRAQIGFGPLTANPQNQPGWTWADAAFNMQFSNDDEYMLQITAPAPGTYQYTSRFSLDGTNWTYCDRDGAGSNAGLGFDPNQLGVWTVTP